MKQWLIALDQFANCTISLFIGGGWADETISARTFRCRWTRLEWFINTVFNDNRHCEGSYVAERRRMQIPPEYRA